MLVKQGTRKVSLYKNWKKNLFGKLKEIFWLSKISLSVEREKNISACFQKQAHFKHPQTVDYFNMEQTFFQKKKKDTKKKYIYIYLDNDIDIAMGENNIYNKLIAMDDVSGLADKSNDFANFLAVSRKLTLHVSMIFTQYTRQDLIGKLFFHRQRF